MTCGGTTWPGVRRSGRSLLLMAMTLCDIHMRRRRPRQKQQSRGRELKVSRPPWPQILPSLSSQRSMKFICSMGQAHKPLLASLHETSALTSLGLTLGRFTGVESTLQRMPVKATSTPGQQGTICATCSCVGRCSGGRTTQTPRRRTPALARTRVAAAASTQCSGTGGSAGGHSGSSSCSTKSRSTQITSSSTDGRQLLLIRPGPSKFSALRTVRQARLCRW
mmetsp:Transcript_72809/g.183472  ORF Transcript_72809/g.183472 Transcript_72809/m.183472 type:complete len:222 (-) Transcript_72809:98-763(-)